ncbi:Peptidase family M23 [Oceanospirillum multiglobuliferum]|uniref:Peptidase M23 domain-containing protein n=1 Tax=Oceanospirillum multiglobuliferum TaxID=64969 RepID=A0A1T4M9T4_9GAMM|nr:M23 family metallopeptidase [Oceanospirillum multiglobuliferum]OPX56193.1 hypothetical protein BTE48_04230 [Oceanospirillum multiglobuliferum]SJZ63597.1 Peptidase family M23 [Oceanospirillum multiglobuliferum]
MPSATLSATKADLFKRASTLSLLSLSLAFSSFSSADFSPKANPVPGGVAVIELPNSIGEGTPEIYFQGQRVFTMSRAQNKRSDERRVTWVGLPLSLNAGKHSLDIHQPGGRIRNVFLEVRAPEKPQQKHIISRTPLQKDLTPAQQQRIQQEKNKIQSFLQRWSGNPPDNRVFLRPTEGSVSQGFGEQRFYNGEEVYSHTGVDMSGQRVFAPADGTVVLIDDLFYQGKHVIIDHGQGLITQYSHLQAINVRIREGQKIRRGEEIGKVGNTGRHIEGMRFAQPIKTPHLHWSVSLNGTYVDPELFLIKTQ